MSVASSVGTGAMGGWTQQDLVGGSLGDLNSANRYVYAGDDPVNLVDLSGKGWWDCFWTGIDAFGVLIGGVIAIASAIVTFVAPNAITAFFAIVGLLLIIESARGVVVEWQACWQAS